MSAYVGINAAAIFGAFDNLQSQIAAWSLAIAVSVPVIGQIWATMSLLRDSDEFVRVITAKRFILAAGIAMAVASAWGFAESYANASHIPVWLVYPLFWACFGLVAPFVKHSR